MPDFKRLPTVNQTAVSLAGHTHPNTPDELAGLALWLKADSFAGLADGAAIGTWADASGNGRHATQATGGKQPLYKPGIINGRPVVRFDGTDDELATATSGFPASAVRTVIAVGKRNGAGGGTPRIWGLNSALAGVFDNSPTWSYYANQAAGAVSLGGTIANASVISVVYAGLASATAHIDGAAGTAFDPNDIFGTSQELVLGNSATGNPDYWNGDIAEVVMYDRALTTAERVGIERGLGTKYGISVAGVARPTEFATAIKWGTD